MRKALKYLLVFIAGIFLLLVLGLAATQTAFVKSKVKKQLVKTVEKQLNLNLEIEKLEGNFYSKLKLKNVQFSDRDSAVANFQLLYFEYDLWELFRNVIQLDSILIQNAQINLWQQADSTWNLSNYLNQTSGKQKQAKRNFDTAINAKRVALTNTNIAISSFLQPVPNKIQNINLQAEVQLSNETKAFRLNHFELKTKSPNFVLNELSGVCAINSDGIQVDSLVMLTGGSALNSTIQYESKENLNAFINANPIEKGELALFVPQLKLLCSPKVKTTFQTVNDSVFAQLEIANNSEKIEAEIELGSLSELTKKSDVVSYSAALTFNNFKLQNWIETGKKNAHIQGEVLLEGTNLLDVHASAKIQAELHQSEYNGLVFDTLRLAGNYANDSIIADFDLFTKYGEIQVSGEISDVADSLNYEAQIVSRQINVSTLVPKLENTKVNGIISAKGRITDPNNIISEATFNLTNSSVYHIPIESLQASARMNSTRVYLDSLFVTVPGANVSGGGVFDIDSLELDTRVFANITSVDCIRDIVSLPLELDSAATITDVYGPVDNLKIGGDVGIWNAKGYQSELEKADANYLVEVIPDSVNVHVNTVAYSPKTGPVAWDTAHVDLNYANSRVDIASFFNWRDTLSTELAGSIFLNDTMDFAVSKFDVNSLLMNLYMPDTTRVGLYKMERLEIDNFVVKDKNRDDFHFSANGILSTNDSNTVDLLVKQWDLRTLNKLFNPTDTLMGYLNTEIKLRGVGKNPIIEGLAKVIDPTFGRFKQSVLETKFGFENQNGFAELSSGDFGNSFSASLNVGFNAYLDSLRLVFDPPKEFEGMVVFDSLNLARILSPFVPNDSLKGVLNGKVTASGEWQNPLFFGKLELAEGEYLNEGLGIDYNEIQTSVVFNGNKIILDTALIYQEDGLVSLSGEVEFDSTLVAGNVTSSTLLLDANRFFLTKNRNYEILLDANTFITTKDKKPEFGGKIKVIRSDVFLPALLSNGKTNSENDVPMLVEALNEGLDSITAPAEPTVKDKTSQKFGAYSDVLTGRLNVEIPRNTWIKSDDMRLELSGDVEIVKTGPFFEIFGNIDVVRGHYILYGRKLNLQESQIIFQGGEEFDPTLNMVAEYVYRGSDKQKRYLEMLVNGDMSDPDITFILDGNEITETDGISILVFGATSDEIGYGNQNGLISSVGSNAVANVISSQLSRTLGAQLKLDMIEVTATESWQSAAFVVGKYISNDIFVIYQRGFGEVDGDEITPETVTVEYELNDNLFLRLQSGSAKDSGADIILKFEKGDKINAPFKGDKKRRN